MKTEVKKDAEWALKELEKYLPLGGAGCESCGQCECSADIVYYIEQVRKELRRKK